MRRTHLCVLISLVALHTYADSTTARIRGASLLSNKKLTVQLSVSTTEKRVNKPILAIYALVETADGSLGHISAFSLDLTDDSFTDQYWAFGKLMALAGTPTSSSPKIFTDWTNLLGKASQGTIPVDTSKLANLSPSGTLLSLPPFKKTLV